jgi:CDP-diglyceride synthetase
MEYIFQCLLIVLPVLLAGITFIICLKEDYFSWLKMPADFGMKFRGKRLFGENKTLRGFIIMPLATWIAVIMIGYVMKFFDFESDKALFDYSLSGSYKALVYGLAYPLGELPNSFIKRQLDIGPGGRAHGNLTRMFFNLLDKIDSLLACGIVAFSLYGISASYIFGAILLGILFHCLTDFLMLKQGLKEEA